jgi:hypothetical protein
MELLFQKHSPVAVKNERCLVSSFGTNKSPSLNFNKLAATFLNFPDDLEVFKYSEWYARWAARCYSTQDYISPDENCMQKPPQSNRHTQSCQRCTGITRSSSARKPTLYEVRQLNDRTHNTSVKFFIGLCCITAE